MLATREREIDGPYLRALSLSLSLPTPTPPRSTPASSLALSFKRTLGSRNRDSTRWRLLHPRQGVGTRVAGASEGGVAHSSWPAVVKGELGRGAPTSAAVWQNPREPSGERASMSTGRPLAPLRHPEPTGAARADSHCQPPRSGPVAPAPHSAHVSPSAPIACNPRSAIWPRGNRHLHFGDSAVGHRLHPAVQSVPESTTPCLLRLAAEVEIARLSEKGALGPGCHRVKLTVAAATSHLTRTHRPLLLGLVALVGKLGVKSAHPPG